MRAFRILYIIIILSPLVIAQGWLDQNRGKEEYRKTVTMQGNNVQSMFGNWENIGKYSEPYAGIWPKGTMHSHIQEMTLLAAAEVTGSDGMTHHVISESYSENPNIAPDGHGYWWNPLPGYANEHRYVVLPDGGIDTSSQIAHSADSTTWPTSWPGRDNSWNGKWNGYFGANQILAGDEAYYVADDAANDKYPYYPFPADTTRRGLGLQCETRLLQSTNSMLFNDIIIHYRITNTSSVNYNRSIFLGCYADVCPGGIGSANDVNSYDIDNSMAVTYAYQNKGIWTDHTDILPGYMAWKLLESPGVPDDGIDNDHDGLIDERQDNDAGSYVFGSIGNYGAACWHWSGDENGNWNPDYDDVGSDGIGPYDANYKGPDADGTEGNGKPDQGEPDFGFLDKNESDQISLTSFTAPAYGSVSVQNEDQVWAQIQPGTFINQAVNADLLWIFASGPFSLSSMQTVPYSACWLFAPDNTTIFRNALTAQNVHNYNYSLSGIVKYFFATHDTIEQGESSVIRWKVLQGATVKLNGTQVNVADSLKVQPEQTTKYTLNTAGDVFASREITIQYNPPGKIKSFSVDNPVIELGVSDSSLLKWSATKGSQVTLNGVTVGINGTEKVLAQTTTKYTLIAEGATNIDTSVITVQALNADKINRALNQKISSSLSVDGHFPEFAVDGDTSSYWQSQPDSSQWITVDLGKTMNINRIVLNWGTSYATVYQLQTINESNDTTVLLTNNNGKGGTDDLKGFDVNGRYVRMISINNNNSGIGCRLNEFQIYGKLITEDVKDDNGSTLPKSFSLEQNYPNPFNPSTIINWQLPEGSFVTLKLYDILGKEVASLVNEYQNAGAHSITFNTQQLINGRLLSSGIYLYRLQASDYSGKSGNFISTKKMILIK